MKQDVSYWLAEVKSLQQQLSIMQQERDAAFQEAAQWRDRYHDETQLRQQKIAILQDQIRQLEAAQAALQQTDNSDIAPEVLESLAGMTDLAELQDYIQEIAQERSRLRRELETERKAHQATREELSLALGDAIDLLTQRGKGKKG
jgi:chromosome segregation ATPase